MGKNEQYTTPMEGEDLSLGLDELGHGCEVERARRLMLIAARKAVGEPDMIRVKDLPGENFPGEGLHLYYGPTILGKVVEPEYSDTGVFEGVWCERIYRDGGVSYGGPNVYYSAYTMVNVVRVSSEGLVL